jgi:lysozyme
MITDMQMSERGKLALIEFEGEVLTPYKCQAGIWTIGVGHTGSLQAIGITTPIAETPSITLEQSRQLLDADLKIYEKAVNKLVDVHLEQHQFDALVSFCFNVGSQALKTSTLLKRINAQGRKDSIQNAFEMWCKGGEPKRVIASLLTRRKQEAKMFNEGIYPKNI